MVWSVARHRGVVGAILASEQARIMAKASLPGPRFRFPAFTYFLLEERSKRAGNLPEMIWIVQKEPAGMISHSAASLLSQTYTDPDCRSAGKRKQILQSITKLTRHIYKSSGP
jgi:hypothetical protein